MRIAYVTTRADAVGGAQVHIRDLSAAMVRAGHEAKVFIGGAGPVLDALGAAGVPYLSLRNMVHPLHPLKDPLALRELRAALRAYQPDIVSTHSSKAGLLGRLAARSLGVPALFTAHGWAFTEGVPPLRRRVYTLAEKAAGWLGAPVITVSEYDRGLAIRHGVTRPEDVTAVHNGMPDVPRRADPARHPPRMIMVARFEPQKDHGTLLDALSRLREVPWSIDFVGGGPLEAAARERVRHGGIAERVRFLGARNDVADLLADAQAFVLITNWEGLPRSIIEAMRGGLPVVASGVGGVSEEVVDGETGFVVPRGDGEAVRAKLAQLLSDPALRARMGRAGRSRYEAHFTFDRMVRKTVDVYEKILRRQRVTGPAPETGAVVGPPMEKQNSARRE